MAITDMGFEIQIDSRERNTHGHIGSKQMTQNVESETFFLKGRARHLSKKKRMLSIQEREIGIVVVVLNTNTSFSWAKNILLFRTCYY